MMTVTLSPDELWRTFRASDRPVYALIQHVTSQTDSQAELRRLMAVLSPEESEALMPEIEAEKARRAAWIAQGEN